MKEAYGYLRVSGQSQLEKTGLTRQRRAISQYAKTHKIRIVKYYQEAITGTTGDRSELARLFQDLKSNPKVKLVVVESLSRLGRQMLISERIIHDFQEMGVDMVSVKEGSELLNGTPERTVIRHVFNAFHEYEKSMVVLKLNAAKDQLRPTQKVDGRKSYEEARPEILLLIKQLRRKRPNKRPMSYAKIAKELNARGFRSVSGKTFNLRLVQYLASLGRQRALRTTRRPKIKLFPSESTQV